MRISAALVAVAMLVAGCVPSTQSAFEKGCTAVTTAYTVYLGFKADGKFSQTTMNRVETAWSIADPLCKNPPTDVASATVQIASILVILARANSAAKN